MNDFLDGELGEFDWGPNKWAGFEGRSVALKRLPRSRRPNIRAVSRLFPFVLMVAVGSATLALGVALAWESYAQTPDAADTPPAVVISSTVTP